MSIRSDGRGALGVAFSVNLNAVGDTFVPINCKKFLVRNFTLTNASTTLAASAATIGAYTAASAGGTAIVTPATATTLTASNITKDQTVAAAAVALTPTYDSTAGKWGLYVRVGVVHGSAATLDAFIFGDVLE